MIMLSIIGYQQLDNKVGEREREREGENHE